MNIKIPEPSEKALEKNGWDYRGSLSPLCFKKTNNYSICVRLSNYGVPHECWVLFDKVVTPDDLIAIGNELKKLEESSMSKGLEELKDIKEKYKDDNGLQRRLNVIEKELKAFEIIKEKKFDTYHFIKTNYQNYNEYLDRMCFLNGCDRNNVFEKCWGILTQEEYELLREVLKDE